MTVIGAVFRKEMLDSLRDRRSLLSLLLFPLVGPLLLSFMLAQAIETGVGNADETITCGVVGQRFAPDLIRHLEEHDVKVVAVEEGAMVSRVRAGDLDIGIVLDKSFQESYTTGRKARIWLVLDSSRDEARPVIGRITGLLQGHAALTGMLRLLARGVNPNLGRPFAIERLDLSTPKGKAAAFLNFIPMFVLLAAFLGGMYTATDATAGERERGSLEPLLITPVHRRSLVMGKWLAAVVFSAMTVVLTLVLTVYGLSRVPAHRLGMSLTITQADVAWVLVAVLPVTLCVASIQMFVASFARSFKEAQTYLSLMVFLPMLPAVLTMMAPMKSTLWMFVVPIFGQQVLMNDIIRGHTVEPMHFIVAGVSAALAGWIGIHVTAALYRRERTVFGR